MFQEAERVVLHGAFDGLNSKCYDVHDHNFTIKVFLSWKI